MTIVDVKTLPHHTIVITPIKAIVGFNALAQPIEGFSDAYGVSRSELEF